MMENTLSINNPVIMAVAMDEANIGRVQ